MMERNNSEHIELVCPLKENLSDVAMYVGSHDTYMSLLGLSAANVENL